MRGVDLARLSDEEIRRHRWCQIAMVFQAAMNSLNPVYCVGDQIIEALQTHNPGMSNTAARARVAELFGLVGLDPALMDRYPHQFSGGMRQRAVIAMALSCDPDIIIADEPTTALDVIVQDNILRQMKQLQEQKKFGVIYISHDIAVIAEVSHRIAIMYAGHIVEIAGAKDIFAHPVHPYTYALMNAFPSIVGPKHTLLALPGEPPDLLNPPSGCRFHPRCPHVQDRCRIEQPPDTDYGRGHLAACWNPMEKPS
jgi:peptide/nickel transport system ATP-binding protein